jgi:hypothetical protein
VSPVLLNLILMHRHGMFYNRYCLPSQVAIMTAVALILAYRVGFNRWAAYAASTVLVLSILKFQVWHPIRYPEPQRTGALNSIAPSLPMVIGDGVVYMEMNHREDQEFLSRLYYLKDPQASLQYAHTNYFQDFEAPDVMAKAGFPFTANVAPYNNFVLQHRQFLLLGKPNEWVFQKLRANGASFSFIGDYSDAIPYLDKTLYLVTMLPPESPKRR